MTNSSNTQAMCTIFWNTNKSCEVDKYLDTVLGVKTLANSVTNVVDQISSAANSVAGNMIFSNTINGTFDGGSGYAVGDQISFTTDGDDAHYVVIKVNDGGAIELLALLNSEVVGTTISGDASATSDTGSGSGFAFSDTSSTTTVADNVSSVSLSVSTTDGYLAGDQLYIEASNDAEGLQFTLDTNSDMDSDGVLTAGVLSCSIDSAGTGYQVGQNIPLIASSVSGGQLANIQVSNIDSTDGSVTELTVISGGIGYSAGETICAQDSGGQAAVYSLYANPDDTDTLVPVLCYAGLNYDETDTLSVTTDGDGSGATVAWDSNNSPYWDQNYNMTACAWFANYHATKADYYLNRFGRLATSVDYCEALNPDTNNSLLVSNAANHAIWAWQNMMAAAMQCIPNYQISIVDTAGSSVTVDFCLSSISRSPIMLQVSDEETTSSLVELYALMEQQASFILVMTPSVKGVLVSNGKGVTAGFNSVYTETMLENVATRFQSIMKWTTVFEQLVSNKYMGCSSLIASSTENLLSKEVASEAALSLVNNDIETFATAYTSS
jgi:hypothetical protein